MLLNRHLTVIKNSFLEFNLIINLFMCYLIEFTEIDFFKNFIFINLNQNS